MKYFSLIIVSILSVIIATILFFAGVKFGFKLELMNSLTLTLYFFSGISTLGAVLTAIYTLHIQAKAKQPNFLLKGINTYTEYSHFFKKHNLKIRIKFLNTGENAFVLGISLEHLGECPELITYAIDSSRCQFDVFKSLSEDETIHEIGLSFLLPNIEALEKDMKNLKPILVLRYKDKNHIDHVDKYSIYQAKTQDHTVFFNVSKI